MKIMKRTITIDVLYREEDSEWLNQMSIGDIIDECNDGDMIFQAVRHVPVEIPADRVEEELLEMGNDGTFFDEID